MFTQAHVDTLANKILSELSPRGLELVKHYAILEIDGSYRPDASLLMTGLKSSTTYGGLPWVMNSIEIAKIEIAIVRMLQAEM